MEDEIETSIEGADTDESLNDESLETGEDKDAYIAKLERERDNYRKATLEKKGKISSEELEKDEEYQEFKREQAEEESKKLDSKNVELEIARLKKETLELRLALKNQPAKPLGGDSGASKEVSDGVFSPEQIKEYRKRAERLGADPDKFIENLKSNLRR